VEEVKSCQLDKKHFRPLHTLLEQVGQKKKDQVAGETSVNTGAKGWDWVLRETLAGLTKPFLLALPDCCLA